MEVSIDAAVELVDRISVLEDKLKPPEKVPYDRRERRVTCAVRGCQNETSTYVDQRLGSNLLQRVFLCEEDLREWRDGANFVLDPADVGWFLVGRELAVGDQA